MGTGTGGGFSVRFRQRITPSPGYVTTEAELKAALEALSSIGQVEVGYTKKIREVAAAQAAGVTGDALEDVIKAHDKACTADGSNVIVITFLTELGNLPDVTVVLDGVVSVKVDTDGKDCPRRVQNKTQSALVVGFALTALAYASVSKASAAVTAMEARASVAIAASSKHSTLVPQQNCTTRHDLLGVAVYMTCMHAACSMQHAACSCSTLYMTYIHE